MISHIFSQGFCLSSMRKLQYTHILPFKITNLNVFVRKVSFRSLCFRAAYMFLSFFLSYLSQCV